jgi:hypothetical protein
MILQDTPEALPKFNMWTQLKASLVPIQPQTTSIVQVTPEALPKFNMWTQLMTSLVPIWPHTSTILQVTPEALPKFHMWTQLMAGHVSSTNNHDSSGYAGGAAQIPHVNTINDKSRPNLTTNIHDSSGYTRGGTAKIPQMLNQITTCLKIYCQDWGEGSQHNTSLYGFSATHY